MLMQRCYRSVVLLKSYGEGYALSAKYVSGSSILDIFFIVVVK